MAAPPDSMVWACPLGLATLRPGPREVPLEIMMPSDPRLADHHRDHLRTVLARYQGALAREGLGGVVIFAGEPQGHFLDDTNASWKPNPHFSLFAPLPDAAGSAVLIPESGAPELLHLQADDFWHAPPRSPEGSWLEVLPATLVTSERERNQHIAAWTARCAGPTVTLGPGHPDPTAFRHRVDFARAEKTPYELACLRAANARAVRGHRAVAEGFRAEDSEFELHLRYLAATGHEDHELPYTNIIGLNERGAILHYHHRTRDRGPSRSLLIDAGANAGGYAADVTRTYAREPGAFQNLIDAMDALQQGIVARLAPGVPWASLQDATMEALAEVLVESGIAQASKDALLENGVPERFMPHGLGHLLGIQVHDAGGQLANAEGALTPPPPKHPALRLTRTLTPEMVVTVEPGLYFIPSFLKTLWEGRERELLNWPLIETLIPFGGIRIEDNVRITPEGQENLTRDAFAGAITL